MKSRKKLLAIAAGAATALLVVVLIIIFAGKGNGSRTQTLSLAKITDYYDRVKETVLSTENYCLDITTEIKIDTGSSTRTLNKHQNLTCVNTGTEDMAAHSQETMTIGSEETVITEDFANNIAYFTVNGASFRGPMEWDIFIGRYAPALPIDLSLYSSVSGTKGKEGIELLFSDALRAESWCLPDGAKMNSATGSVQLSADGKLAASRYCIQYQYGTAAVDVDILVAYTPAPEAQVVKPNGTSHTFITELDVPRYLEILYGHLLQTDEIFVQATESIDCQASGIQRTQRSGMSFQNKDTGLNATLKTDIYLLDYSTDSETEEYTQTESFQNGNYSISVNGGEAEAQENISAEQMLSYCQDLLVKNLILPENIAATTISDDGDTILMQITGTEELAQLLCSNICTTLFDDPELLRNLASSYKTNQLLCNFRLDKYTGLPVSGSIDYIGEHTIEGFAYTLTYKAEISYGYVPPKAAEPTPDTAESTTINETTPPQ